MSLTAVPDDLVALAHRLADAAGAVVRPYFRRALAIDDKTDASPVTVADRGAEQAMRALLSAERPQDGVWGEEFGQERPDAEWVWVLDPIDGTKSFVMGKPIFATLIGLTHRGAPVLGVIDQPVLRERWSGGVGHPALFNGRPIATRECGDLAAAWANTTTPDMFQDADVPVFQALCRAVKHMNYGGDAYAYGLLASGFVDLVVEAQLKFHDYAALVPVMTAAGGVMTDWVGRALDRTSDGRVLAAGDPVLHAAALAIVQDASARAG